MFAKGINRVDRTIDQALSAYLGSADSDAETRKHLSELLENIAKPLIQQIVKHSFRQELSNGVYSSTWQSGEDVTGDVLVKVLTRLYAFKANPQRYAIYNFRALVATITYRTLTDIRRENNRQKTNLERKIRRLCAANELLAIWNDEFGASICGYAAWLREIGTVYSANKYASHSDLLAVNEELKIDAQQKNTAEILLFVLNATGRPIRLKDLIEIVFARHSANAQTLHIDEVYVHYRHGQAGATVMPNEPARLETRRLLEHLFQELGNLTPVQCKSLLLNMTDYYGYGIEWLIFSGIATEAQLADLLEVPMSEFRQLLDELPMTDKQIGERLQIDPAKVANIRKAVRDRLKRRRQTFLQNET